LGIWERNFQLALGSFPIYLSFILCNGGGTLGFGGGWSFVAWILAMLGAAGGLLVALSIKYGDSILKTLATTGAIILSSVLDHIWLGGPLTPVMVIAGGQVIIAICNYTFDATPVDTKSLKLELSESIKKDDKVEEMPLMEGKVNERLLV
jgi:UDP-sugar transporter A1/2/3